MDKGEFFHIGGRKLQNCSCLIYCMEFQSYPSPQSSPSRGEEIGGGGDLSGIKNIVDSDTLWKIWITLSAPCESFILV